MRKGLSAWWWLVTASALVLAAVGIATAIWWSASRETRTTPYNVVGDLSSVKLDLGGADVEVDGGADAVRVVRTDDFAFGHPSIERRSVAPGRLQIVSRCPRQVLGSCRASYRVSVPDNVAIDVATSSGSVRIAGVRASVQVQTRSGDVAADGFCGFSLRAISEEGNLHAAADCSTERLELRSRSGSARAVVPAGRYRVDAESDAGRRTVRGVTSDDDAPYTVQVLSTTGDVTVDGA